MKFNRIAGNESAPAIQKDVIARSRKLRRKRLLRQNLPLFIMFAPVLIYFLLFKYGPILGLVIAFKQYSLAGGVFGSPWVGMANFEMLFNTPQMLNIIRNTLMLSVLQVVVGFPLPILLAILLNEVRKSWFKKSVQTLVYLPHFFSWVVIAGIVIAMLSMESGIINVWVQKLTGDVYPFLYEPVAWVAVLLASGVWKTTGFSAIIYLAALSAINPSLYESASMDGANKFRQIWHVTLPGISGTIILMLILSMGQIMEVGFDQVFMLQNSVVAGVSEVISTYVYKIGLLGAQYSVTTALGFFESLVGLVLVLTANWIARRFNRGLW
ncbi:ABC transporter permease [Aureibacillus halotolerans]|nr:ABC transporter permease subunit [Aureibacillus halotolerans]